MKVSYCKDIEKLKEELVEKGFYDEESETFNIPNVDRTPVQYGDDGKSTLSFVQGDLAQLEALDTIVLLGTYEEIFADADKDSMYKSVYPYDVPITYVDEEGVEQSYLRPKKIGLFA